METQFSTTFIPKKPVAVPESSGPAPVSKPLGILSVIAWIIFVISIIAVGGSYLYKNYLAKQTTDLQSSVAKVEKNFEPTLLNELTRLDKRLTVGDQLLHNHKAVTPFFDFLESSTLPNIRFSKIDFTFDDTGAPKITLSGEAESYRAIAQQSRIWGGNQYIKNHIFSNFILTPKGRIAYDLVFYVSPDVFLYGSDKNLGASPSVLDSIPATGEQMDPGPEAAVEETIPGVVEEESVQM